MRRSWKRNNYTNFGNQFKITSQNRLLHGIIIKISKINNQSDRKFRKTQFFLIFLQKSKNFLSETICFVTSTVCSRDEEGELLEQREREREGIVTDPLIGETFYRDINFLVVRRSYKRG